MMKRPAVLTLLAIIATIVSACGLSITTDPRQDEVRNVELFLQAIALGDDATAEKSLSQTARQAVQSHCPNGSVTACFDKLGRQSWGRLKDVIWALGMSEGGSLYVTDWDNDVIDIVFRSAERDGLWEIDGWRGIISASSDRLGGVVDGSDPVNQFPPAPDNQLDIGHP